MIRTKITNRRQPHAIARKSHSTITRHKEVSKGAKIRSRYNQVPHPTQDTNGKVTNSQLDTTNESQEVSQIKQSNQLSLPHQGDCNTRMDIK